MLSEHEGAGLKAKPTGAESEQEMLKGKKKYLYVVEVLCIYQQQKEY